MGHEDEFLSESVNSAVSEKELSTESEAVTNHIQTEVQKTPRFRKLVKVTASILSLAIIISAAWWSHAKGYLLPNLTVPTFGLTAAPVEPVFFGMDNLVMNTSVTLYNRSGDLTIMKIGQEPLKLASDVLAGTVSYLPKTDNILYITKDFKLYLKSPGKDAEMIAADVNPGLTLMASEDESRIFFAKKSVSNDDNEGDLFLVKLNTDLKEKEKLGSISQINVIKPAISKDGNTIAFVDKGDLYIKLDNKDKEKIASSVAGLKLSDDGKTLWYESGQSIYVKYADQQFSDKLTQPPRVPELAYVQLPSPTPNGKDFIYLDDSELYSVSNKKPQKLASDVSKYELAPSKVFYTNRDLELCSVNYDGSQKTKIASDVTSFKIQGDTVIYDDRNDNLYVGKGNAEPIRIASDVSYHWQPMSNGIVLLNKDSDLITSDWKGTKTKIASDVAEYSLLEGDTLVYYNRNKDLFIKKSNQEPISPPWKLTAYTRVYLMNSLFFQNLLGIDALSGYWTMKDNPSIVLEFVSDLKLRAYMDGILDLESPLTLTNNTETSVVISFTADNQKQTGTILLQDKDHFTFFGQALYERISLQQFNDKRTAAIKKELSDIDWALKIADRYESNNDGLSAIYNGVLAGTTTLGQFNSTADLSLGKQRTFMLEANSLVSQANKPELYADLTKALSLSIDSCSAWIDAADYLYYDMPISARRYQQSAESCASQSRACINTLRTSLKAEQDKLNQQLSSSTI